MARQTEAQFRAEVERRAGYAAVALVGLQTRENTSPFTIVVTGGEAALRKRLSEAQRWNEHHLDLIGLVWCETRAVAERVQRSLDEAFEAEQTRSRGPWFRADGLSIQIVFGEIIAAEGSAVFDEDERVRRLEAAYWRARKHLTERV